MRIIQKIYIKPLIHGYLVDILSKFKKEGAFEVILYRAESLL